MNGDSKKGRILKKIGTTAKTLGVGILDILLSIAETTLKSSMSKKDAYRIAYGYVENEWTVERLCKFFSSLKSEGYIEIQKRGGQESIVFTDKAKIALVEQISGRVKTDGKYRYVSFDIPEPMRRQRNAFRRDTKKMGFKQIQKSLWVIDKDVGELVELAARKHKVEKYIAYIIGEKSDIDGYIAKLLKKKKFSDNKLDDKQ